MCSSQGRQQEAWGDFGDFWQEGDEERQVRQLVETDGVFSGLRPDPEIVAGGCKRWGTRILLDRVNQLRKHTTTALNAIENHREKMLQSKAM